MNWFCLILVEYGITFLLILKMHLYSKFKFDSEILSPTFRRGAGAGAIVGGLVAGPLGAVVGAAIGTNAGKSAKKAPDGSSEYEKLLSDIDSEIAVVQANYEVSTYM